MKTILIFLVLVSFSFCRINQAKMEEMKKRRKEEMKYMVDCLLKNENTSKELKKAIENSTEDDYIRAIHHSGYKLDKNDKELIRLCRKEAIKARHEEFRKADFFKKHEKEPHHPDL